MVLDPGVQESGMGYESGSVRRRVDRGLGGDRSLGCCKRLGGDTSLG